ncbi:hypothetical protein E3J62_07600 [candidate division TA06 bacterium]|uniref:Uncharacterized protein n=1 Tax=candidate division TA06 bacterium TaxID=2250710 RepID=A0A523US87_UNCT6|nr:MAG: hypothetical protein E3J62_07600 [candidate division TA06 bacterium]
MGKHNHDKYVKGLLMDIGGNRFVSSGPDVRVKYEGRVTARIDGVFAKQCAIEIESRVAKQIRGAVLDLLEHDCSRKLLILVPAHIPKDQQGVIEHCKYILAKYMKSGSKPQVILLKGKGGNERKREDRKQIRDALRKLRCL